MKTFKVFRSILITIINTEMGLDEDSTRELASQYDLSHGQFLVGDNGVSSIHGSPLSDISGRLVYLQDTHTHMHSCTWRTRAVLNLQLLEELPNGRTAYS